MDLGIGVPGRVVRAGGDHAVVRIEAIAVGDIVKASIGGQVIYGEVLEIRDQQVHFHPLSCGAGWHHATARQVVGHWRKPGRRRAGGGDEEEASVVQPPEQLAFRVRR
jgi:hypothetical protein